MFTQLPAQRLQHRITRRAILGRPREQQAADQGTHELRHALTIHARIGLEPKGRGQTIQVQPESTGITGAGGARQADHIGADRHHHAARTPVVAVPRAQVAVDEQTGPRAGSRRRGDAGKIWHRIRKRRGTGLGNQLRLVLKMRIKPPVGQPGTPHHLVYTRFRNPMFPKCLTGSIEDPSARHLLVGGRVAHRVAGNEMTIVIPRQDEFPSAPGRPRRALTLPAAELLLPTLFTAPVAEPTMQQLHAYWRMEYIEAPRYPAKMRKPFTELPALGNDREALIVHRSKLSYLVLNRFPYNPGHLLAVPFREVEALDALTTAERADLFEEIILAQQLLQTALRPDAFNIGFNLGAAVAGGSIAHLHGHIVPRWNGDNNFMPVIGQARILPQALDATWEKLAAAVTQLGPKPRARRAKRR